MAKVYCLMVVKRNMKGLDSETVQLDKQNLDRRMVTHFISFGSATSLQGFLQAQSRMTMLILVNIDLGQ